MTANDRFKSGWDNQVAWSTTAAAVLHLVLLMWTPALPVISVRDTPDHDRAMESIVLLSGAGDVSDGLAAASVPGRLPSGSVESPVQAGDDIAGDPHAATRATGRTSGNAALRDYLRRRTEPGARIVDAPGGAGRTDLADAPQSPRLAGDLSIPTEDASRTRRLIDAAASAAEQEEGGDRGGLGLDRLSAVQPELAYHAPSPWLLIQNPDEVEVFLQRNFRHANQLRRTVSVALWIDDRGSVEWAEINRSSGLPDVDESALELFSRIASYRPAREQGVRVPIAVIFSLTLPL